MHSNELLSALDNFFQSDKIKDYAPNGLQIEGKKEIRRVLTAVSASQAAIEAAIDYQADALFVHHGYFWKGEAPQLTGIKYQRIKALLAHDINLIAYHLPLDLHPQVGNNALFGQALSVQNIRQSEQENLLWHGDIAAQSTEELQARISRVLRRPAQMVGSIDAPIRRIAWCTGAAQDYLALAAQEGAQAFLSGEYAERTFHEAHEWHIGYFSCGHHATERFGVEAMAERFRLDYALESRFFDEDNPF